MIQTAKTREDQRQNSAPTIRPFWSATVIGSVRPLCPGAEYVDVTVHPHHVRRNPHARDLDPHGRVEGMWDFKRIHETINRQSKHLKAI